MKIWIKTIITLLSLVILNTCQDSSIIDNSKIRNEKRKDLNPYFPFIELNGYKKNECIEGCYLFSNNFYKIVLESTTYGKFLTKKAYSVTSKIDLTGHPTWHIVMRFNKDFFYLKDAIENNLKEDSPIIAFESYNSKIFPQSNFIACCPFRFRVKLKILTLTKKECDKWMKNNVKHYTEL